MSQATNLPELIEKMAAFYRVEIAPAAAELWIEALGSMPFEVVRGAALMHLRKSKFMPTVADIFAIIDEAGPKDPWPNALQALAMYADFANDETRSGVTFPEVETAWGQAKNLGDPTKFSAQKLFIEVYDRLVREAKAQGRLPVYRISEGTDKAQLKEATRKALSLGQITDKQAMAHLPYEPVSATLLLQSAIKEGSPASLGFVEKLTAFRKQINEQAKRYDENKAHSGSSLVAPIKPGHSVRTGAVKGYGEFKAMEPA